jgi:hypothetical protein
MNHQYILSHDFDIVKLKNKFSIIFVENVDQDIEQLCLEEDYIDELEDYYSDYDYPFD